MIFGVKLDINDVVFVVLCYNLCVKGCGICDVLCYCLGE